LSESLSGITYLSVFIIIRLSRITSVVTRGLPSFRIFGNVSDPRPNPTQQKAKNLDPTEHNPTQPNSWVDPTHGQLWSYTCCIRSLVTYFTSRHQNVTDFVKHTHSYQCR